MAIEVRIQDACPGFKTLRRSRMEDFTAQVTSGIPLLVFAMGDPSHLNITLQSARDIGLPSNSIPVLFPTSRKSAAQASAVSINGKRFYLDDIEEGNGILLNWLKLFTTVKQSQPVPSQTAARPIKDKTQKASRPALQRSSLSQKHGSSQTLLSGRSGRDIFTGSFSVVGIGASTGGVAALSELIPHLSSQCPPVLVVQHTRSEDGDHLVKVLQKQASVAVCVARDGQTLQRGTVYLAGDRQRHLKLDLGGRIAIRLDASEPISGHRPSVDAMFESLSALGSSVFATILTGMGQDGAKGLKRIYDRGGWTIGQDEASSLVYGMPRVASEAGALTEQLSLDGIANRLSQLSGVGK